MTPLASSLKRESDAISRFVGLLEKEHSALGAGKTDSLANINADKITLIEELNRLEAERIALLPGVTNTQSKADILAWFAAHPVEQEASILWGELLELARKARELHTSNGALVAILLQRTGEALDVLTQRQKSQTLYRSDGQASALSGSRIVDSA